MSQVPDIPEEPRSFEDGARPFEQQPVEQNGHAPEPSQPSQPPSEAVAAGAGADAAFGNLKQDVLNRWNVRDARSGA